VFLAVVWAVIGGALALPVADAGAAIGVGVACAVLGLILPPPLQLAAARLTLGHLGPAIIGAELLVAAGMGGVFLWAARNA